MAILSCCVPGRRAQLAWSATTALLGAGVVGASVWLWVTSADTKTNADCVLGGYNRLKTLVGNPPACSTECTSDAACTCTDWSDAGAAFEAFQIQSLDAIKMVLDLWDLVVIAPGAAYAALVLLVALLAYLPLRCRGAARSLATCAKVWNGLGVGVLLWVAIAAFGTLGALGLGRRFGAVNSAYESAVVTTCNEQAAAISDTVAAAEASFDAMGCDPTPPGGYAVLCNEASGAMEHADLISTEFTRLCSCVGSLLEQAEPMAAPAITGLVLTLLLVAAQVGVCSVLGCCSKYVLPEAKSVDAYVQAQELEPIVGEPSPLLSIRV